MKYTLAANFLVLCIARCRVYNQKRSYKLSWSLHVAMSNSKSYSSSSMQTSVSITWQTEASPCRYVISVSPRADVLSWVRAILDYCPHLSKFWIVRILISGFMKGMWSSSHFATFFAFREVLGVRMFVGQTESQPHSCRSTNMPNSPNSDYFELTQLAKWPVNLDCGIYWVHFLQKVAASKNMHFSAIPGSTKPALSLLCSWKKLLVQLTLGTRIVLKIL